LIRRAAVRADELCPSVTRITQRDSSHGSPGLPAASRTL
jgi:hypothetical protein